LLLRNAIDKQRGKVHVICLHCTCFLWT